MSYYGARSRLTKMMLDKVENDNFLSQIDQNQVNKCKNIK